ncbi:MAG: DUF2911 domain-containing protein [Flavobacteriales bacterium]|nr:DUF2911 domain-containing protein [Flavobacteriales bacterium]
MKNIILSSLLSIAVTITQAQINIPQPSPLSTVSQKVGLVDVSITYSRPSAKGRKIFGELVPYDKLWRTGANMATKLTVSDSVKIAHFWVPKGEYAIFTVPGPMEWIVIISKQANLSGINGYQETEDVGRFKVKPVGTLFTETFTINFANVTTKSAEIQMEWETTRISFPIVTEPDRVVMKNIELALNIPGRNYYQAANYYYENDKDLNKALEWINMAITNNYERYWVLRVKSLIQAKLGDYKGAITTAERSIELAKKDNDEAYVKMNEESIKEWKKKLK